MSIPMPAVLLVTGASSGIGAEVARMLAGPGRTLHLQGRNLERLESVSAEVTARGGVPVLRQVDLSDHDAVEELVSALAKDIQRLDVLVHSAGLVTLDQVEEADVANLDRLYAVNLRAPFAITTALTPALVAANGQVVFVNSGLGRQSRPNWSQYAATKFGLRALADAYRAEVEPRGVRVTTIYPGRTASPMQAEVHRQEGRPYDPERHATTDDVAGSILHVLEMARSASVQELTVRQRTR